MVIFCIIYVIIGNKDILCKEKDLMRFVQKWSYSCARHVAAVLNENHNKRAVYYYGFYIIFGSLVKGTILISLSLLLGVVVPALLTVLVLGSLRMFAGGFHFDTYGKCLFVTLVLVISAALISKYTYSYWSITAIAIFLILIFVVSLFMLIKYAPKDTPTKPITEPEAIKKYKRLSIAYLSILLVISVVLAIFNLKMYVIAIGFGILLEIFTITPAGHSFFTSIKNGLNKKGSVRRSA